MSSPVPLSRRRLLASTVGVLSLAAAAPLHRVRADVPDGSMRKLAVTIDDGPATGAGGDLNAFNRITRGLREAFVAEKVPCCMFVNERQLHVRGQRDARIAAMEAWIDAGLDLGNHTFSHPRLSDEGVREFTDDILKGEVVSRLLLRGRGRDLVWFRYPFLASGEGETARAVEAFLAARGYRIAPVTVDYSDFRYAGPYARLVHAGSADEAGEYLELVLEAMDDAFTRSERRSRQVLGRELVQILLIHCNEMNSLTLRTKLRRIRDRGYTFVTLEEALEDPAYQVTGIPPGGLGGGGWFGTLERLLPGQPPG